VQAPQLGEGLLLKVDYLFPSGSYKDRGSAVMVSKLAARGVKAIMDDSSGNAGASIAAYAAAASIPCTIYAPAETSPGKLAQIETHGARLVRVDGDRAAAVAAAAQEAAERIFYASHIHQPLFIAGCSTLGFEIWEQCGFAAPDAVFVAVGYGSQLLGLHRAFTSLLAAGVIERMPRLYAVQTAAFPALARAFAADADDVTAAADGTTVAEGIACRQPARGPAMLRTLRESGGAALTVTDDEIAFALRALAGAGYFVEPTGAVSYAGYTKAFGELVTPDERAVVVLSGSGLKAAPLVRALVGGEPLERD
jgi:threonine synthase